MEIKLRSASVPDGDEIARIRTITWRDTYAGLIPDSTLAALDPEKDALRWRNGLENMPPGSYALIAEVIPADNAAPLVVGYAFFGPLREPDDEYDAELYAIYILPNYHRLGIGRIMFEAAMDWLARRGHKRMLVYVLAGNTPSRKFYERMGGIAAREQIFEIDGAILPEVGYGYQLPTIQDPNS